MSLHVPLTDRMTRDLIEQARVVPIVAEIQRRGILLKRLGNELIGACPRCGGTDRFSVAPAKGVWNCRHCKPASITGDVIGFVMWCDGLDFTDAVKQLAHPDAPITRLPTLKNGQRSEFIKKIEASDIPAPAKTLADTTKTNAIASALRWWKEAGPIEGTIGTTYFERDRRILELPPEVHEVIRFHPRCIWGQNDRGQWVYVPAIVCLLRDVITDKPIGVHRIGLHPDGRLLGRKALGRKKGAAVKLWSDADITTGLVIGEGVETVLAAATHVRHRNTLLQPAWSLVDGSNISSFPVLPGGAIEYLTILADADSHEAGQKAARTCAKRWADGGCDAEILIPDTLGEDFNDLARRT
jgi:hypothetical protein